MNNNQQRLQPQSPAEGISQHGEDFYHISCECTDFEHAVVMVRNNDEEFSDVEVEFYVNSHTPWDKNRFRQIWDLLSKGYIEYQSSILLSKQSALNMGTKLIELANKELPKKKYKMKPVEPVIS